MKEKVYYKKLDIIRVISCIAIFLYHLNILKGGFLAVCTFFVLSGYLSCKSAFSKEKFSSNIMRVNINGKVKLVNNYYYTLKSDKANEKTYTN